ncbi:MAG TPA: AI-2E family transporter [Noviherbaspirillum sp.]
MTQREEAGDAGGKTKEARALRVELTLTSLIMIVLVIAGVWTLLRLMPVVLVLVTALFIVGTLSPSVDWLEAKRIRRTVAIALVFGALLVVILLLSAFTLPALIEQVKSLIAEEPSLREQLADYFSGSHLTQALADTLRNLHYDALLKSSASTVFAYSTRIIEVVAYGVGAIFLALYMMIDRDRLRGALFSVVPRTQHIRLSRIILKLQTIVGGYIRGQLITCLMMTVFVFLLLSVCGVPNALAISVFGGLADMLPFIGIFLTMGPAVVAALSVSSIVAMIVFTVMLAYEEFESRVLVPLVYGRALRLPSSVVLFSLITGATLLNVVGALLALPVAAAILMLVDELQVDLPGESEAIKEAQPSKQEVVREEEYVRRTEGVPVEKAAAVAIKLADDGGAAAGKQE